MEYERRGFRKGEKIEVAAAGYEIEVLEVDNSNSIQQLLSMRVGVWKSVK